MYRQKKEREDIAKGKTEPSLSPAGIKVRPGSDFPWEPNTSGKVLRPPGKSLEAVGTLSKRCCASRKPGGSFSRHWCGVGRSFSPWFPLEDNGLRTPDCWQMDIHFFWKVGGLQTLRNPSGEVSFFVFFDCHEIPQYLQQLCKSQ